jgi:hypothetical protein
MLGLDGGNKGKAILVQPTLSVSLPAADLADRFGPCGSIGGMVDFISSNNWLIGAEGAFFFGSKVKEDPLAILRTPEGDIIGRDQAIAEIFLRQRAWYVSGTLGRLWVLDEAKRQGIRFSAGAGWTQHKIRTQDDTRTVNQVTGAYAKGYDRLTGGIVLTQFVGWQKLGRLRRSNWLIGFELQQGLTQTRREWDFSEKKKLTGRRLDLRFGLRAAWTLPFYLKKADEIYY